jgi:hypothetical protein
MLIEYEHKKYYEYWVKDGKPTGYLWEPNGEKVSFFSKMGFLKNRSSMVFKTPEWIKNDMYAKFLLFIYRIVTVILYGLTLYIICMGILGP